jgi:hypothetical protein
MAQEPRDQSTRHVAAADEGDAGVAEGRIHVRNPG